MTHDDHVALLRGGVPPRPGQTWADLGAGQGAFTLALAELLGPGATIHAVDRDAAALRGLAAAASARFPAVALHRHEADFRRQLELPGLDGAVMANSLHFVAEPGPVLARVRGYLRPGGHLILVEYDAERGNTWVPHPIAARRWPELAAAAGFGQARELASRPSRFLGRIYSALAVAPGGDVSRFTPHGNC